MRLINWISSLFATRSKPTAEVDLPTRIVRTMRREGGGATPSFLSAELAVGSGELFLALEDLLARGTIRADHGSRPQPCVAYVLTR